MHGKTLLLLSTAVLLAGAVLTLRYSNYPPAAAPGDLRDAPNSGASGDLLRYSGTAGSTPPVPDVNAPAQATGKSDCEFFFAWGHDKEVISFRNANPDDSMVIQGCDVGQSGFNMLEEVGLCQNGHNGDWFYAYDDHKANAGFGLFTFPGFRHPWVSKVKGIKQILKKNNLLGFMRMTQTNFIGIMNKAMEQVQDRKCAEVKIKFTCPSEFNTRYRDEDGTRFLLGTDAFQKRIANAFETELDPEEKAWPEGTDEANKDLSHISAVLNAFGKTCGNDFVCGSDGTKSFPEKCGQEITVDKSFSLTKGCLGCYEYLKKYQTDPGVRKHIVEKSSPQWVGELQKYLNLPPAK